MKFGLIGLGNMGFNLMLNWLDHGHNVVVWNRGNEPRERARSESAAVVAGTVEELVNELKSEERKVIFLLVAAGPAVDLVIFGDEASDGSGGLANFLNPGDVIVDLANSHYSDSQKRAARLAEKGIEMLDIGISGGTMGARNGACMMVGGNKTAFDYIEPALKDASVDGGYGYFGGSGSGHFVKMVHNGIEYGMMQSISEGISLINAKEVQEGSLKVDYPKLLDVWNHGSIIESKLVGFLRDGFMEEGNSKLDQDSSEVGDLGTGRWTTEEALRLGIPLPAITAGLYARYQSRDKNSIAWRAVSAMRRIFGAHSGKDRQI